MISLNYLVVAIEIRGVDGAPFHTVTFPQASEIELFQPKTAFGKLNAEIIPTIPSGFHCSIKK